MNASKLASREPGRWAALKYLYGVLFNGITRSTERRTMMKSIEYSRRTFFRKAGCGALGLAGILSSQLAPAAEEKKTKLRNAGY